VLAKSRALLDRGRDAGLLTDHFVLAGGRVWGRVQCTGECTSEVRRVTDAGYRDLVTLRSAGGEQVSAVAPRGILEGSGGPLCRVRLVRADEPVSVGDVVVSAAAQGCGDGPLVYGEVVRAECPTGASHWDIWVKPAIDPRNVPDVVSVLRIEFNPARVASREK
jgi:cell shape-determining protein MreC